MLPGLKSMLNIHPLFVHFPIAFWFAALLFEALAIWRSNDEWHRTAVRLLYLGTLAAFPNLHASLQPDSYWLKTSPEGNIIVTAANDSNQLLGRPNDPGIMT